MYREGQDESKPWYDQPKTFVTPYQLKAPYDNIWVGEDPTDGMTKEYADQWDAIVNVSSLKSKRSLKRPLMQNSKELKSWSL